MKVTEYYCNICGRKVNEDFNIKFGIKKANRYTKNYYDLCHNCVERLIEELKIKEDEWGYYSE